MGEATGLLFSLAIIMVSARILEEIAERMGQPALLGDVVAGLVLGPGLLRVVEAGNTVLDFFGTLGVVFLLLLAGLKVGIRKLEKVSTEAALISLVCSSLSIGLGYLVGKHLLGYGNLASGLLGISLSITASAVFTEILEEMGQLSSRIGRLIVSAGVFDDVIGLGAITLFFSAITATGQAQSILLDLVSRIFFFFAGSYLFGYHIVPRILKIAKRMKSPEATFGVSLVLVMGYAAMAEYMGLHALIGAFVAGLALNMYMSEKDRWWFEKDIKSIAEGFFAPIFFVLVGASLSISNVVSTPIALLTVIAAAFFSKFAGGFLITRIMGGGTSEAFVVGSGMVIRGSVALVVVHMAQKYLAGIPVIENEIQSVSAIVVSTILIINLVAIPLFKWGLSRVNHNKKEKLLRKMFPSRKKKE